jgi:hypothetical protein
MPATRASVTTTTTTLNRDIYFLLSPAESPVVYNVGFYCSSSSRATRHGQTFRPRIVPARKGDVAGGFLSMADDRKPPGRDPGELQGQVDRFTSYYNEIRPHRAAGHRPQRAAFEARDKARPSGPKIRVGAGVRVRRDRIDQGGKATLRHGTRLHHIGVGHAHKGKRVTLLADGLDVRVV